MGEMVRTQIDLPYDLVESLKRRSEARGITLPEQVREALTIYLENSDDPILRADDPIFRIAGEMSSGVGDLSTHHDRHLYRKDWQQPQGGAAG